MVEGPVDLSEDGPFAQMMRLVIEPVYDEQVTPAGAVERVLVQRSDLFTLAREGDGSQAPAPVRAMLSVHYRDSAGEELVFMPGFREFAGEPQERTDGVFYRQTHLAQAPFGVGSQLALYAFAVDKLSLQRDDITLTPVTQIVLNDAVPVPELSLQSPLSGEPVRPMQWLELLTGVASDAGVHDYRLLRDGLEASSEVAGVFGETDHVLYYQVPRDHGAGVLRIAPLMIDMQAQSSTLEWSFPIVANEPPEIELTEMASYQLPGENTYGTIITDPQRLDYAEFWLRTGESFRLSAQLRDDVALARYEIVQLGIDGSRTSLFEREYAAQCPNAPPQAALEAAELRFTESIPTEYELVLTDTYGHRQARQFIIHPLANVSPQIRFTAPAPGQYIAAGTFAIQVGLVLTDDRRLAVNNEALRVYANGRPLSVSVDGADSTAGEAIVEQKFASMYDSLESTYSVAIAELYGSKDSPFARRTGATISVPSGLLDANEPVILTAEIVDSDGAVGRTEVSFLAAPDDILPEVAISAPASDFGAVEGSDFTLAFRAYDNVKVNSLELYTAYGAPSVDGDYQITDYATPLSRIAAIPDVDAQPVTTVNIDTPLYQKLINVPRINQILNRFPDAQNINPAELDLWVRLVAIDNSGNRRERTVYYPVRVDQRPVVDITSPVAASQLVEGSRTAVSVTAFDDVGIQQVRMTARLAGSGEEIANLLLREAPYAFELSVPALDPEDPANNRIEITVDAIDTYGALSDDPDAHRAIETLSVEIVADQPPTLSVAAPANESSITEGEYLLVQVAAIDDVGFERVELLLKG